MNTFKLDPSTFSHPTHHIRFVSLESLCSLLSIQRPPPLAWPHPQDSPLDGQGVHLWAGMNRPSERSKRYRVSFSLRDHRLIDVKKSGGVIVSTVLSRALRVDRCVHESNHGETIGKSGVEKELK